MTANKRPDPFARATEQSTQLIAQARQLDSRLRSATQTDRQLTRRAASHLTQLARRLSVLLSRTSTALPMIPVVGVGRRLNHYVLHAERLESGDAGAASVRMLTIGSNGMLRTGSTDLNGSSFVWIEYDPFDPGEVWDVDTVLQWLADALQSLESQVEAVETRTRERTQSLDALVSTSKRPGGPDPRTPPPFPPGPAGRGQSPRVGPPDPAPDFRAPQPASSRNPSLPANDPSLSRLYESAPPPADAMEELAFADDDGSDVLAKAQRAADVEEVPGEDAAARHRRELFKRIR